MTSDIPQVEALLDLEWSPFKYTKRTPPQREPIAMGLSESGA